MKKLQIQLLILGVIICSACGMPHPGKVRSFQLTYETMVKDVPSKANVLDLWIPVPQTTDLQTISEFTVKTTPALAYTIRSENKRGNKMLFIQVENPPSSINVTMKMKVDRRENSAPYSLEPCLPDDVTLGSNALVPINDESRAIAKRVTRGLTTDGEKARALVRHTLSHMTYDKKHDGWGRGDFDHACDVGKGNCTDFHAYFISLCRSLGIRAYFEIGLPLSSKKTEGKTGGYHCWAYYEDDGEWIPVDISEADKNPNMADYFSANHCENRVAFTTGRDIVLSPAQKGSPLNYFIGPYAEVDGQLHSTERKTTFRDN